MHINSKKYFLNFYLVSTAESSTAPPTSTTCTTPTTMKIKTISRSSDTYLADRASEASRMPRNLDPALHPFERAREYTQALNATKLERMFAKPFVGQLGRGHVDAVYCIAMNPRMLNASATGSGDGVIKYWDLSSQEETYSVQAHDSIVRGLGITPEGHLLSCASDKTVKLWDMKSKNPDPKQVYLGEQGFNCIDHQRGPDTNRFATGCRKVQIWDTTRSKPLSSLSWGADTITSLKFSPSEHSVFASTGSDRALTLYDIRTNSPINKLVTSMNNNALCWNPQVPFAFAAANEDHNVYLYDMRNLSAATSFLQDHVAAVMDVDFSPTGREIVTASYDKTIRIFNVKERFSRDIYHTRRMQRVFSTKFTLDNRYILSGSDDGNVRLWRAKASEKAGIKTSKEKAAREYTDALKERYRHMPEVRSIARHRHVPVAIKNAKEIKGIEKKAAKRREDNERKHNKSLPDIPLKERHIVGVAIKDDKKTEDWKRITAEKRAHKKDMEE